MGGGSEEANVGYGNDGNAYEMATTTEFPAKPDRRKGGDSAGDESEPAKGAGYSAAADYDVCETLESEGAGGADALRDIPGAIVVSIPAASIVAFHSQNDEYTPEHADQTYVASLGVVLGTEGGAAGEAASADEGTFAGAFITGLRAAAAAASNPATNGDDDSGLAVGQRLLAINGVNMMSEPLASVTSVMAGAVVFAAIGMPANSIELVVLPDPDGFEGIPVDTKAPVSAAAAASAMAAAGGGGGGGGGSIKAAAGSAKLPAGVWLKKKAEGVGRSKKRYFTLSKGTVNIPPVFWYWEHCDKSGNGHSEKGSIQLVSGCSVTFDGKTTISIATPDRVWNLLADNAKEGSHWTTILNDELARVAGRDAAEVAAASGQPSAIGNSAAYSSVTVAMLSKLSAEQRTSLLEAVKRGRATMQQLLEARKLNFSGNRFVGLGDDTGIGKIDIASAMSLKLLSKFDNSQRLIILTAIKNGEVSLKEMETARRIAFIDGKLVLGSSKTDEAFMSPDAKRNADLKMLKRFTEEQRIAILTAVAKGKLTVKDLLGSRRIKVEKDGTVTVSNAAPANGMFEFCPKCKARTKEGRQFCTRCGHSLVA